MKRTLLLCNIFLSCSLLASATPTLTTGTPGNSQLATPTGPSPTFGTLINFDSLVPNTPLATNQFASAGVAEISSPDGLAVVPFSTQSFPNEVFDESTNGTAQITIKLEFSTNQIGIGIADSDPVSITLQALAADGTALGGAFSVTIPQNTINPGNGYFVVADSVYDIAGLQILQPSSSSTFSGMAIDDLQVAPTPEPSALPLAAIGMFGVAFAFLRRRSR